MNGLIFKELEKFIETRLGAGSFSRIATSVGLERRLYMPVADYPDTDALTLVNAVSTESGASPTTLFEDFGQFIAPNLLSKFGYLLDPSWRTLQVLLHTEASVHETLRRSMTSARPPTVKCTQTGPREVVITYSSARKLCAVARGIIRGIARHFGDDIILTERSCMHRGDPVCELHVELR